MPTRSLRLSISALVLGVCSRVFVCAPVSAQEDATRTAAARALFTEGVEAVDAEDWARAEDRFSRAQELRSSPAIELNLAIVRERQGRLVEATEGLQRVIRSSESSDELKASARALLEELEPRIAWARVSLEGNAEGVTLFLDARPLPSAILSAAIPVDPGVHRFAIRREGQELEFREVELEPGASLEIALSVPNEARTSTGLDTGSAGAPAEDSPAGDAGVIVDSDPNSSSSRTLAEDTLPGGSVPSLALESDENDSGEDSLALGLGIGGGILLVGGIVATVLVVTLPQEPMPFVGNAGLTEVRP